LEAKRRHDDTRSKFPIPLRFGQCRNLALKRESDTANSTVTYIVKAHQPILENLNNVIFTAQKHVRHCQPLVLTLQFHLVSLDWTW